MSKRASPKPEELTREAVTILRGELGRKRTATQADLAAAVDISKTQLSDILNEKKLVDIDLLDRLCWALGLDYMTVLTQADAATASRHAEPDWDVTPL